MADNRLCIKVSGVSLKNGDESNLEIPDLRIKCQTLSIVTGLPESVSTLFIRLLGGTYKPAAGKVELWERPVEKINRRILTGKVSIITRHDRPGFSFPVGDFVRQGKENSLQAFQASTDADRRQAENIMRYLGIDKIAWRDSNLLGRSDLIRTLVARSLVQSPSLLLIDNFLHDINETSKNCILSVLYNEVRQNKKTVVVTSNDPGPLARYADQLIVFSEEGLHEQIDFSDPQVDIKMRHYLDKWGYASMEDMFSRKSDEAVCARSPDDPLF